MRLLNDIVVFDDSMTAIENLGYLQITATPTSRITQYPVENGSVITDSKIILPKRVRVRCCVMDIALQAWKETYLALKKMHASTAYQQDGKGLCAVQSGCDVYKNLSLVEMPNTEDVSNMDVLIFDLNFQEIILAGNKKEECSATALDENHYTMKMIPPTYNNAMVGKAMTQLIKDGVEDEASEAAYTATGLAMSALVYADLIIQ